MIYGYARVSTKDQKIQRQIDNITEQYPNAKIFQEHFSAKTQDRPEYNKLMKAIKPGDTIVFDEVSRMSRNAEGKLDWKRLYELGVNLVFIKDPASNTQSFDRRLTEIAKLKTDGDVDVILAGVREYLILMEEKRIEEAFEKASAERERLSARTIEGMRKAKEAGKQIGGSTTRVPANYKENLTKIKECLDKGIKDADIMKIIGVSRPTYYKYKKEIKGVL